MEHFSTKDLIDEVAERHGIMLDEKDPILVTLTLNELIIENYIKAVEASISKINARQIENAKLVGEEIITKGAQYLIKAQIQYDVKNTNQGLANHLNSNKNSTTTLRLFAFCFLSQLTTLGLIQLGKLLLSII